MLGSIPEDARQAEYVNEYKEKAKRSSSDPCG